MKKMKKIKVPKEGVALADLAGQVGLYAIAEALGCSHSTVWRALKAGKSITVYPAGRGQIRAQEDLARSFPDANYVR